MVSSPAPPSRVSLPVPPLRLSLPAPPVMLSLPAPPSILSLPASPVRVSAPTVPLATTPMSVKKMKSLVLRSSRTIPTNVMVLPSLVMTILPDASSLRWFVVRSLKSLIDEMSLKSIFSRSLVVSKSLMVSFPKSPANLNRSLPSSPMN